MAMNISKNTLEKIKSSAARAKEKYAGAIKKGEEVSSTLRRSGRKRTWGRWVRRAEVDLTTAVTLSKPIASSRISPGEAGATA